MRVAFEGSVKVKDLAANVQQDLALALPHAPWGPEAFEKHTQGHLPPTLFVQQASNIDQSELKVEARVESEGQTHVLRSRPDLWTTLNLPFAIILMLVPTADKVLMWAKHDDRVVSRKDMVRLVDEFERVAASVAECLGEGGRELTMAELCPRAFATAA